MGELPGAALFQKDMQGSALDFFQCGNSLLSQKTEKNINIGLIGLNGIICKAPFGDQVAEKKRPCCLKLLGNGLTRDGQKMCCRFSTKKGSNAQGLRKLQAFTVSVSLRPSCAIEFPELSAGLGLFATLHDAGFLIAFTTFQFSFNTIDLQFFLQLSDGVFNISTNFNFYHLGLQCI